MGQHIRVAVPGHSYPVVVGEDALGALPEIVGGRPLVVVSSRRVWRLHGALLTRSLQQGRLRPVLVADGEAAKTRATLARVHDALLERALGRDGVVVAFGGGVVTDLAGFAAATWLRGVAWIPVPTTLLAMADAAVGGKVGINHPRGKNLIGAFHQPLAVVAPTRVLATLPAREMRSGAFEVLKCGLVADAPLVARLREAGAPATWSPAVREAAVRAACRIKARIVSADEREGGLRRVLNLGHTVGHALETVTGYRLLRHGEAVGWGLLAAADLARGRGLLDDRQLAAVQAAVAALGPRPSVAGLPVPALLEAIARDKKKRAGRVPFVLPDGIGAVRIVDDVTAAEVTAVLRRLTAAPRVRPRSAASAGSPSARAAGSRPPRRPPTAGRR